MSIQTLRTGQFIHGQEVAPASGAWLENIDPATGGYTGLSARGNAADIDAAVVSAKAGLKAWLALLPYQRGQRLQKLAGLLRDGLCQFLQTRDIASISSWRRKSAIGL